MINKFTNKLKFMRKLKRRKNIIKICNLYVLFIKYNNINIILNLIIRKIVLLNSYEVK